MPSRWKPNVTVAAVIPRRGRFLLVEEEIVGGRVVFNQPAGHLEPGEDLIQAVCREVREETAHAFTPVGLVGVYLFPAQCADVTFMRFCFHGTVGAPDPGQALDDGILSAVWMSRSEIQAEQARLRTPMVLRCLEDWRVGRSFPLDMLHCMPHLDAHGLPVDAVLNAEGA